MKSKLSLLPLLLLAALTVSCSGSKNADFEPVAFPQDSPAQPDQEALAKALLVKAEAQKQKLAGDYGVEFLTNSDDADAPPSWGRTGLNSPKTLSEGSLTTVMFLPQAETTDADLETFWEDMLADLWAFGLLGLEIKNNQFLKTSSDVDLAATLAIESRLAGQWSGSQILSKTSKSQRRDLRDLHGLGLRAQAVVLNSPFYTLEFSYPGLDPEALAAVATKVQENCSQAGAVLKNADDFGIKVINVSGTDIYCAPGSLAHLATQVADRSKGLNAVDTQGLIAKLSKAVAKDAYQQSLTLLADNGIVYTKKRGGWVFNKKKRKAWERAQYEDFVKSLRGPQVTFLNVEPGVASQDQVFREAALRNGLRTLAFHIRASRAWAQWLSPSDSSLAEMDQRRLAATADFYKWKDDFLQINSNPWGQLWVPSDVGYTAPKIGTQPMDLKPNYDLIFKAL